jgi:hypothetical protein
VPWGLSGARPLRHYATAHVQECDIFAHRANGLGFTIPTVCPKDSWENGNVYDGAADPRSDAGEWQVVRFPVFVCVIDTRPSQAFMRHKPDQQDDDLHGRSRQANQDDVAAVGVQRVAGNTA